MTTLTFVSPQSFTRQDSLVRHARLHCKKQEDTKNVSKALNKHKGTSSIASLKSA